VHDLPRHLDARLASIPGEHGDGRWLIEIGCGERLCEAYFTQRGFRYVGTDVNVRGRGPHLLADAHNPPFADGSFDLYASMAVYEQLASPLLAAIRHDACSQTAERFSAPRHLSTAFTTEPASIT